MLKRLAAIRGAAPLKHRKECLLSKIIERWDLYFGTYRDYFGLLRVAAVRHDDKDGVVS